MTVNCDRNCSFIGLATVTMIINYDRKTFIVQVTIFYNWADLLKSRYGNDGIGEYSRINNIFHATFILGNGYNPLTTG